MIACETSHLHHIVQIHPTRTTHTTMCAMTHKHTLSTEIVQIKYLHLAVNKFSRWILYDRKQQQRSSSMWGDDAEEKVKLNEMKWNQRASSTRTVLYCFRYSDSVWHCYDSWEVYKRINNNKFCEIAMLRFGTKSRISCETKWNHIVHSLTATQ